MALSLLPLGRLLNLGGKGRRKGVFGGSTLARRRLASELRKTQSEAHFWLVLMLDVCVLGVNGFGGPMVMGGLDSVD